MLSTAKAPKGSSRSRRQTLLAGAAIAVALTALGRADRAQAQSVAFQGTPTVTTGSVSIDRGTTDTFTVNTTQAVIDWTTFDQGTGGGPIAFLPSGSTAFFQNSENISDFTVLNRIVPTDQTRGIRLDGTIQSRVNDVAGGSVWFFSPGGILAGSTAVFDVGNLVLTTNAIDTTGGLFGPSGEIRFRGASGSLSAVEIQAGAQITARNQSLSNAYVALVAPRVVQNGTVDTFGSAAYVGAEQADLRIDPGNGLFTISITTGTSGGNAIVHNGTTTGPQQFSGANRVYMTTIAKNDAVTMLINGTVGYTPAASASLDNGVVVLGAGYDVDNGSLALAPENGNRVDIVSTGGSFTSDVTAHATGNVSISPNSFGTISFSGDATLEGDAGVSLGADTSETIAVGGNLSLISDGGNATLFANFTPNSESFQGSVTIDGDLQIDASLNGDAGEDATGGTALLDINGGAVTVARNVSVLAIGRGGFGDSSGDSTGGTARITLNGGSLTVGDDPDNSVVGGISVIADAQDASQNDGGGLIGGNGTGGTAEILVNSGAVIANTLFVSASGVGGRGGLIDGDVVSGGVGGDATGGTARVSAGPDGSIEAHSLTAGASAQGGGASFVEGNLGGNATGGAASVVSTGGAIAIRDQISIDASAYSGASDTTGEANGGSASLTVTQDGAISGGFANLSAFATGDFGGATGGSAFSGDVTVGAESGGIALGDLSIDAEAFAGSASLVGGDAIGGTVTLYARGGGSLSVDGNLNISADATGGSGDAGGDANGGLISVTATDGALALGNFAFLSAGGDGGASFDGAPTSGSGGVIDIATAAGANNSASISFGSLFADADGEVFSGAEGFALIGPNGETPGAGTSGLGTGGEVTVTVAAGTMTGDQLSLSASGRGGDAGPGGIAGDGEGGIARFRLTGGAATIDSIGLDASGDGGRGAFGDVETAATAGGNGFGGTVEMTLSSGSLTTSAVSLSADGEGGDGGDSFDVTSGDGGKGFGGEATFTTAGTATVALGSLGIETDGFGGEGGFVSYFGDGGEGCGSECGYGELTFNDFGGRGGDGYGGHSFVELDSGALSIGSIFAEARGFGGEGGIQGVSFDANPNGTGGGGLGGSGFGGQSMVTLGLGDTGGASLEIRADGLGGEGGFGLNGGSGGAGTGGMAKLIVDNVAAQLTNAFLSAEGEGGNGERGFVRNGGDGGDAIGGTAEVRATGANAALTLVNLSLDASANGGFGGDGIAAEGFTADFGGQGGAGGDAMGGNANIVAELGQLTLETGYGQGFFDIDVSADGGFGGRGGNGAAPGASGGAGGAGGSGAGGTVLFESLGGQLVAGDLFVSANGFGGEGGFGGSGPANPGDPEATPPVPASDPIPAPAGANGFGAGGLIQLKATNETGAPGAGITFGNTVLEATGFDPFSEQPDIAGRIMIDVGADSTIQLASLQAQALGTAPTLASRNFSFFGMLDDPDGVLLFDFGVSADTTVTLRTYSYAGGTNAAGQTIVAGGFDPILALFNGTGQLINQNDDGGSNVPADPVTGSHYDTFLQVPVTAGNYQVSVTAYSNFASGPNLSNGFDGGGSFNGRTQQFAFDVLGADSSSGPGAALKTFQLNTTGSGLLSIGGDATIDVGGDASFRAAGITGAAPGGLQVGGNLFVDASGSVDFGAVNNGAFEIGGLLGLTSDNAIGFSHTTPGAEPTIHAGQILIDSGGMVTGGTGAVLRADGNIDVFAAGDVAAGGASFISAGGDIDIDVAGNISVGSADAFDTLALTGLTVTAGSLSAGSMGDGTPENVIDGIGVGARGAIDIGSITSAVDIGVASLEGGITIGSLSAGDDAIIVGGADVTLGDSSAGGVTYIAGVQLLDIVSGGEFSGVEDLGRVDGEDLLGIFPPATGGNVTVTGTLATGDLRLNAGGNVDISGIQASRDVELIAFNGAINVTDDLSAAGVVRAAGRAISLTSLSNLDVDAALATDGDLELTSAGDLFVDQARSAGDIRLTSTGASVILGDISIGAEGGQNEESFQRSTGFTAASVTAGDRGPGDILVDAALDIRANGDVTASRSLSMDAGRDIQINGLAFGTDIDLSSADISIGGEGGRVGLSTLTQSVSFTNTALDTQTFIGGTGGEGGYRLDSDEIGRVFTGGDVSVTGANASQSTGANNDVMLQTMTVRGQTGSGETAGQIGNSGRFTVQSPGAIVIVGDIDFAGLADTAGVTLDADRQIRLAAESGSLSLRSASNALAGELILSSDMIIAGTADAIADVGAATSTDAINDRLGQSEGTASDDGFFAANTIRVDAGSGFFVQNTGVAGGDNASRRGLTVGSGGLSIATDGPATRIVINGRQMNADGSFTAGVDLIARTTIGTQESSSAQFDQRSTINGCLIAAGAACTAVEPPPPMPTFDPTPSIRDVVSVVEGDEGTTGSDPGDSVFPTSLVSLADFETFGFEPLIDEPVTGAGNEDLWIAPEEGEEEQCTNAAGEKVPCQR